MARAGAGPAGGGATKHRYTKEAKVGEGTYAIVYLGRQAGTNRRVAIKSIRIGAFKDGLPPSQAVPFHANSTQEWICPLSAKSNTCRNFIMRI